jgi:uncharacterized protein YdeI (YjbR/CyaY-like superfamily)
MEPLYFASPDDLRAWFEQHHDTAAELHVGYLKAVSGGRGLTHRQAVEQALCFGWIDGVGRRVDDERWRVRFTPRRPGSVWSDVNVASVERLTAAGLMRPAGLAAFERRRADRTGTYSFEQAEVALDAAQQARLEADAAAWAWFSTQAPWYRKAAIHWVTSAKKLQTRESRLTRLIADSAAGRTIPPLTRRTGTSVVT